MAFRKSLSMIDWWGPVISEYYGSTEMGPLTFRAAQEWLENPGSVGTPGDDSGKIFKRKIKEQVNSRSFM
ncbi:hypothetical protein NUH86_19785 [Sphingobium sp. JS3065]|jgi:hypothetical protein|uniref:hypothetical protein n=1 Tax=Sphingobium sp. JS3065 TaxID=2970925 RepID=UPI0022647661|nr:hypothetical protein [Sphingobium sp. JS3065]UZW56997.1 hypothetical protein NUH86_19785 [Sphingobium sp. JS3065]